jgi:hypothetical protein
MKDRISQDIKEAMKNKNAVKLSTLRMIMAELQRKEKEKGIPVNNETAHQILQSMIRRTKEAIEQFRKGGREDLAEKEQQEVKIIEQYLPEQLSEDEIIEHVHTAISELGVRGPKEMGRVMGVLVKKLSGRADGSSISRIVKEELQKLQS